MTQPLHRADERNPAVDEPTGRHVALPPNLGHLTQGRAAAIDKAGGSVIREARKLNAPGAVVVVVIVLAACAVYFIPPIRSASSEPVWTKADQLRFEESITDKIAAVTAQLESERKERKERDEKQEAQMKEWREIANLQAINLARLIDRESDLRERVKALEARPPR